MCYTVSDDWAAAMAAWNSLSEAGQARAIGYVASADAGLVAAAAAAAADAGDPPLDQTAAVTAAIWRTPPEHLEQAMILLAGRIPAITAAAIADAGTAVPEPRHA